MVLKHMGVAFVCLLVAIGSYAERGKQERLTPIDPDDYEGTIRVACIGNSVTYGYGLSDGTNHAYPAQLQELLGDVYAVRNFGHNGATLLENGHRPYIETEEYKDALAYRPHVVIIHLGLNDTDPRNWPNYQDEFISNYTDLIAAFLKIDTNPQPKVWICRMTPIFHGHPRFKAGTRDWFWQIQEAIAIIARHNAVSLIDLHTSLYHRPDLFPDNLHPVAEGAEIIAATVYSSITGQYGGLKLPTFFGDHMVLQRSKPIPVWGTADFNQEITVDFNHNIQSTRADAQGKWRLDLPGMEAGGPHNLHIYSEDTSILLRDILIGEVWLCSGQSNMAFRLDQSANADAALAEAELPEVRLFNMKAIARAGNVQWPEDVLEKTNQLDFFNAKWQQCTAETAAHFSAVAYYFGKSLHEKLRVPIGLIHNAKGGSPTEAWIDRKTMEFHPVLVDMLYDWKHNEMIMDWCRERAIYNTSNSEDPYQRHPFKPCYLYETGISALTEFPIKGVIWYQGESNAHNVELHEILFPALVASWRQAWGYPLPFYFVQLSGLNRPSWPHFRDSQRLLNKKIPNTAMVVSSDHGHPTDVHPKQKKPIGHRLARCAMANAYEINITFSGPEPVKAKRKDDAVIVFFTNADGLNHQGGDHLIGFEMAGANKIFKLAQATIKSETVELHSNEIPDPRYVRYAWQPFTKANLYNGSALPASTFLMEIQKESTD